MTFEMLLNWINKNSIIEVSDNIIYADKSKLNLLNKNKFNLDNSNSILVYLLL